MSFSLFEPEPSETPDPEFWENTDHREPHWRPPRRSGLRRLGSRLSLPRREKRPRPPGLLADPDFPGPYGPPRSSDLLDDDHDDQDEQDLPDPLDESDEEDFRRPRRRVLRGRSAERGGDLVRSRVTGRRKATALLVVAASLGGVTWYVVRRGDAGGHSFTGTVLSNAVVDLTFARAGQVARISVHVGQKVRGGQLLAAESGFGAQPGVATNRAKIAADKATLARLAAQSSQGGGAGLTAARAKLAGDQARLAAELLQSRIVAPMSGTVVTISAKVGEAIIATGPRDFLAQPGRTRRSRRSAGAVPPGSATGTPVPVISLRTSRSWQVLMVVPASLTARVKPGEAVTITVPTANLSGVPGRIEGLLPTPVRMLHGTDYQALVAVLGQSTPPLGGLAADIRLGS